MNSTSCVFEREAAHSTKSRSERPTARHLVAWVQQLSLDLGFADGVQREPCPQLAPMEAAIPAEPPPAEETTENGMPAERPEHIQVGAEQGQEQPSSGNAAAHFRRLKPPGLDLPLDDLVASASHAPEQRGGPRDALPAFASPLAGPRVQRPHELQTLVKGQAPCVRRRRGGGIQSRPIGKGRSPPGGAVSGRQLPSGVSPQVAPAELHSRAAMLSQQEQLPGTPQQEQPPTATDPPMPPPQNTNTSR